MKTIDRYVLFYCDNCDLLIPAIKIFNNLHAKVRVETSSDVDDLFKKIDKRLPELLLVYLHDPVKDYMQLVKSLRQYDKASLPILIYRDLPDEEGLKNVFNKIS